MRRVSGYRCSGEPPNLGTNQAFDVVDSSSCDAVDIPDAYPVDKARFNVFSECGYDTMKSGKEICPARVLRRFQGEELGRQGHAPLTRCIAKAPSRLGLYLHGSARSNEYSWYLLLAQYWISGANSLLKWCDKIPLPNGEDLWKAHLRDHPD